MNFSFFLGNITEIQQHKVNVLRSVRPLSSRSMLLGQYSTYPNEARVEMKDPEHTTSTPTYAAALLHIHNTKWKHTPFLFISGKKLDVKESYIRVMFRDNSFCMKSAPGSGKTKSGGANSGEGDNSGEQSGGAKYGVGGNCGERSQIVFYIGGSDLMKPPMILVSKNLFKPIEFPKWRFEEIMSDSLLFGENITDMYRIMPQDDRDPYSALIEAVFAGERHLFIDVNSLMASWDVWTPVINKHKQEHLQIYEGGENSDFLDFHIVNNGQLQFDHVAKIIPIEIEDGIPLNEQVPKFSQIPSTFRDQILISGDKSTVIAKLAADILQAAHAAISSHGSFHIALPGGATPVPVFEALAQDHAASFPWDLTHIWLTDERCVPLDHPESNFNQLHTHLLQYINIPYLHIHPMPVHLSETPCDPGDSGDSLYTAQLKRYIPDTHMDYILLGVGTDGHVASLFPGMPSLAETDALVAYTPGRSHDDIKRRMTFTFPMINQARNVAVLITDAYKHDIVHTISETDTDVDNLPVTGVKLNSGNMTWYIDHAALIKN